MPLGGSYAYITSKKRLTELSTARCETPSNNEGLSASTPPVEGDELEAKEGGDKVMEAEQTEEAIRATAQQLVSVLGKACPFSGEGLWKVRSEEMPAKAWDKLSRLMGVN